MSDKFSEFLANKLQNNDIYTALNKERFACEKTSLNALFGGVSSYLFPYKKAKVIII